MPDIFKDYFHKEILGLFVGGKTMMPTLIFYNIFLSFGVNVLMYSSAMSSIDDSVIESASLDGVTPIREFWSIVVPLIFPTLATFLVVGVAAMFTDQAQLFALFGAESCPEQLYTIGYFRNGNAYFVYTKVERLFGSRNLSADSSHNRKRSLSFRFVVGCGEISRYDESNRRDARVYSDAYSFCRV